MQYDADCGCIRTRRAPKVSECCHLVCLCLPLLSRPLSHELLYIFSSPYFSDLLVSHSLRLLLLPLPSTDEHVHLSTLLRTPTRSIAGLKAKKEVEAGKHQLAVVSATTRDAHNPLPQGDNRKLLLFKAILESKDERIRVLEEKREEGRRIVAASPTKVTTEENVFDGRQRIQGGAGRSSNPHGENSGGGGGGGAAAAAVGSNKKIAGRSNGGGGGGGGGAKAAATARDGSADDSDESDMEL